jgi:hypothetical protein
MGFSGFSVALMLWQNWPHAVASSHSYPENKGAAEVGEQAWLFGLSARCSACRAGVRCPLTPPSARGKIQPILKAALAFYSGIRQEHWLRDKWGEALVILEDGPVWEIDLSDRSKTVRWLRISTITVERTQKERYSYVLMNSMENDIVRAISHGQLALEICSKLGAA